MIYLSVIIPVLNEERYIGKTLQSLSDQDYPKDRYELIVVDGDSTDATRSVIERFIEDHPLVQVKILDNPGRWSSRGRNIGVRASRGKLIAVIDAHVHIPDKRLFANIESLKEQSGALCLGRPAPLTVPGLKRAMGMWIALARKTWLGHSGKSEIYRQTEDFVDPMSNGFAYDRSVFEKIGYFDETFDAAEDVEFHFRLKSSGILAYTSPKLMIYSYPRESLRGLFHQMTRYGLGRANFIRKHRSNFSWETPVPALILLMSLLVPVAVAASQFTPLLSGALLSVFCLYSLAVLATGIRPAVAYRSISAGLYVPLAVWTLHLGLGLGLLKGLVKANNSNRFNWDVKAVSAAENKIDNRELSSDKFSVESQPQHTNR